MSSSSPKSKKRRTPTGRVAVLRATNTAALVGSCAAIGVAAMKLGFALCGEGLLALGAAFLLADAWSVVRGWRPPRHPAAIRGTRA